MKSRPDSLPALLFAGAVVFGAFLCLDPGVLWTCGAMAVTIAGWYMCRLYRTYILATGLIIGLATGFLHQAPQLPTAFMNGQTLRWTGQVMKVTHGRNSQSCIVQLEGKARIRAVLYAAVPEIEKGDIITFKGVAEKNDPFEDLNVPGLSRNSFVDGPVAGCVRVQRGQFNITADGSEHQDFFSGVSDRISHFIYSSGLDPDAAALLCSAWLGRDDVAPDIRSSFRALGLSHLLCVSGMHVGLVAWLIAFILRPLAYWQHRGRMRYFLIIVLIWIYAALTGLQPSAFRAATMITVFYIVEYAQLHRNTLNTLFLAAAVVLIINPWWIFAIGFQLSIAAVFGIIVFIPRLNPFIGRHNLRLATLGNLIALPVAVTISTFPIIAYWFHSVSLIGIPANIVGALVFPVFMFAGLISVLLLHIGVPEIIAAGPVDLLTDLLKWLCDSGWAERSMARGLYLSGTGEAIMLTALLATFIAVRYGTGIVRKGAIPFFAVLMLIIVEWPTYTRREAVVYSSGGHATVLISGQQQPLFVSTRPGAFPPFATEQYIALQGYDPDSLKRLSQDTAYGEIIFRNNRLILPGIILDMDTLRAHPGAWRLVYQ